MTDRVELDRWLDDALADYVNVEPRPGLENRIVARVASETNSRKTIPRWSIAMGAATLAILLLSLCPAFQTVPAPHVIWSVAVPPPMRAPASESVSRRASLKSKNVVIARSYSGPKLDRFPSQSPLTEQELTLVQFAQNFPQRAALVAQAQTDLQRENEKEMSKSWPAEAANTSKQD